MTASPGDGDERDTEIAALAALMRGLPLLEGRAAVVDEEAWLLWFHAMAMATHDAPSAQPLGAAGVRSELSETMRLANLLGERLRSLHQTTLDALAATGHLSRYPVPMQRDLVSLFNAGQVARKAISTNPPPPTPGARPKKQAKGVTMGAAECFERLTGKPPTECVGQFRKFLGGVFKALGIKASPTAQIKSMGSKSSKELLLR